MTDINIELKDYRKISSHDQPEKACVPPSVSSILLTKAERLPELQKQQQYSRTAKQHFEQILQIFTLYKTL